MGVSENGLYQLYPVDPHEIAIVNSCLIIEENDDSPSLTHRRHRPRTCPPHGDVVRGVKRHSAQAPVEISAVSVVVLGAPMGTSTSIALGK